MRSSRRRSKANLSIILPASCSLHPGLCIPKHPATVEGSTLFGKVTATQTGVLGVGVVAGFVGLYAFNKFLIRYKQAKATKEVDKQQDAVKALANQIRQKNPAISQEIAYRSAHKALEEEWIRKYEAKQKAKYAVDPDTMLTKDEEDYIASMGK